MSQQDDISVGDAPRQRILDAATQLFAEKGFARTGVREIASRANVNLSMINYYFGSKTKVLEEIITLTTEKYGEVLTSTLAGDGTLEERIRGFFRRVIPLARAHPELLKIMSTELHFEVEEIAEFKADRIRQLFLPTVRAFMQDEVNRAQPAGRPGLHVEQIGPMLPGMVVFHFLIAPVFRRASGLTLDDAFYESFAEQLADFVLYGLVGRPPASGGEDA